ncbi:MAG: DUF4255 domain-containing protein [Alistipes sp.]|nr:DUF4255 domain-containing protein [Alistipes sp.]
MIYNTLHILTTNLTAHLRLRFGLHENIVVAGSPGRDSASGSAGNLFITLLNAERETAAGIRFGRNNPAGEGYAQTSPAWQLNLYIMFSAIFPDKQYEEGLKVLSATIAFLQSHTRYTVAAGSGFCIEPVNITFGELSNIWGMFGRSYHPSVICKVRLLDIDSDTVTAVSPAVLRKETGL